MRGMKSCRDDMGSMTGRKSFDLGVVFEVEYNTCCDGGGAPPIVDGVLPDEASDREKGDESTSIELIPQLPCLQTVGP